jgi:hypothetical protein
LSGWHLHLRGIAFCNLAVQSIDGVYSANFCVAGLLFRVFHANAALRRTGIAIRSRSLQPARPQALQ